MARALIALAAHRTSATGSSGGYATFDLYLADQRPKNQAVIRALRRFVKRVLRTPGR